MANKRLVDSICDSFGKITNDSSVCRVEILENKALNELMGIDTDGVYHKDVFNVTYYGEFRNGEFEIVLTVDFDKSRMAALNNHFTTDVVNNILKYSGNIICVNESLSEDELKEIKHRAADYIIEGQML